MAKKKATKTKAPSLLKKFKSFYSHHHVIGTLLIIVGVWALIWLGQVGVERYKFYQAEKELNNLAISLKQVSSPANSESSRDCSYSSEKFSKGTLRCSIYVSQTYNINDLEKANLLTKAWLKNFVEYPNISAKSISSNKKDGFVVEDFASESSLNEVRRSFKFKDLGLNCSYIVRPESGVIKNLKVLVGCTGKSKFEYFPARE